MSEKAPVVEVTTYLLNGITYVPHYRNSDVFVGPGYPKINSNRYSSIELLDLGAERQRKHLWSRGSHGIIDAKNP